MLKQDTIQKIENFVSQEPRSINEIANHLGKNWRTTDRYIKQIEEEFSTLTTKTFRKGTRGALKIVFPKSIEKISHTVFQKKLEEEILNSKNNFSVFDIFQHVEDKNKKATIEKQISEKTTNFQELTELLNNTKKEILMFSGDLSWVRYKNIFNILEELSKKGVKIKVLSRVDLLGKANTEKMLSLNHKHGKENIEIRHREQPIRAIIIDNKIIRLKEIKQPAGIQEKLFIFYTIKDSSWSIWLSKIFRKMFSESISAEKRLSEIKKLKE